MQAFNQANISHNVFVFCALGCEAKPLISAWRLKKMSAPGPFAIYVDQTRVIVVTGLGKVAMAGAVGYVLGLFVNRHPVPLLINLGIAGHSWRSLGEVVLAHKVVDSETGRNFFPQLPLVVSCKTASLLTNSKPQANYLGDNLYDMEAAGFYEMAVKFSSSELIHVLKIVSDNTQFSFENINETLVENWINGQLQVIDALVSSLIQLQETVKLYPVPSLQEHLLKEFRFTVTNVIRLKALLLRWSVVRGNEVLNWTDTGLVNASQFLNWLELQLDRSEFRL